MVELIITARLHRGISRYLPLQLVTTRSLTSREINFLRRLNIERFYLPSLDRQGQVDFLKSFDQFWDNVIFRFNSTHPFWRNVVSSKVQEWESSVGYLIMLLYTLSVHAESNDLRLLVVTSNIEEEQVWLSWARNHQWHILEYQNRFPFWRRTSQEFKNLILFLKLIIISYYRKFCSPKARLGQRQASQGKTVLMSSLFYPWSFDRGRYYDPFFGQIHNLLSKNHENLIYLNDYLVHPDTKIASVISSCGEVTVNVPYSFLNWIELSIVLWKVFFRRFRFQGCNFHGCDFSSLLMWNTRRFSYDFNINAEIFYGAVKHLCRKSNFSQLIYIFEGNTLERAGIQAFRQYSSGKISGYSHGVIFTINLKLRLSEKEGYLKPEPDRIICTGPYTKNLLVRVRQRNRAKMLTGCSLRYIPLIDDHRKVSKGFTNNLLIALDGVGRSISFLDWLFKNEKVFKGYRVYLRSHPNIPIKEIVDQCLSKKPENFIISHRSLEEDLKDCFCVFYRHTSIGIQALLNNIPVVHLAIDTPLSGDPIEELKEGKWVIHTPQELEETLKEIQELRLSGRLLLSENIKNFLTDYFAMPTEERLQEFVQV